MRPKNAGVVLVLAAIVLSAGTVPAKTRDDEDLRATREAVTLLSEFAAIPSASQNAAGVDRAARWLETRFGGLGFRVSRLGGGGEGNPVLLAEREASGGSTAPSVLFYLHYDTQPTGPAADWEATGGEAFSPRLLTGRWGEPEAAPIPVAALDRANLSTSRLYGRGVADDKAPIVMHLVALGRWLGSPAARRLHLKFLLDGEEEAGSPHLDAILAAGRERLESDLLVLCDGPMDALGRPSLYLGTRGDMHMRLEVTTASVSAHSGNYGLLPDAAYALAELLSTMKDDRGNVVIDGFFDDVVKPSSSQREEMARASEAEPVIAAQLGVERFTGDPDVPYFERLLFSPGLVVNQIDAGRPGNQIPHVARALLEIRLVPDQDPRAVYEAVRRHVAARMPGARLDYLNGVPGNRANPEDPVVARAIAAARGAAGQPLLVYPNLGGTLPLLHSFAGAGFRYVGLPLVNFDNNQHVANENVRVEAIAEGIRFLERFYTGLAGE